MKVEKGYYADGEDAYDMTKFFKSDVEKELMRALEQPIETIYPGAICPIIEYPEYAKEVEVTHEEAKKKQGKKKHKKRK